MNNPTQHAKAAMQMAFELFAANDPASESIERAVWDAKYDNIDLQFWGMWYSQVKDARTVRITSSLRATFEQDDISGIQHRPARHNIVHEAWHVVQAQGYSRIGWYWHYVWNWRRLEREADEMAIRYRDKVK